jgi:Fic family protein
MLGMIGLDSINLSFFDSIMKDQIHWIWTSPTWPKLSYDQDHLIEPLGRARETAGHLRGKAEAIGADELALVEGDVWAGNAVATSAIEGEVLDMAAVRSSVASRLGTPAALRVPAPRNVEGLLDVMNDAAANWQNELSEERLIRWQAALFPESRSGLFTVETGTFRTHGDPMQIVSGPVGKQIVHYLAPPSAAIRAEMRSYLDWFNSTKESAAIDGILRAGLAHFWFESIHPFADGNGRVGRALIDMAISQDMRSANRLHGISMELRRRQTDYYAALNHAQRGTGDVTDWLLWFIDTFRESCRTSLVLIDEALARAKFWNQHRNVELNGRQRKALNRMLSRGAGKFEGGMTPRKYMALTKAKYITANRDLVDLVAKQLLVREGAGRSTYYNLTIPGWGWVPAAPAAGTKSPRVGQ